MDYYVDLKMNKNVRTNVALEKTYANVHKALTSIPSSNIGVSFPEYKVVLGSVIRLHGTKEELEKFMDTDAMKSLDNCNASKILKVPENCDSFVKTSRIQSVMSNSKLNRLVRRGSISEDEKKAYKIKMLQSSMSNPFILMKSGSNKNFYKRFFQIEKVDRLNSGTFDSFGTSQIASVPCF